MIGAVFDILLLAMAALALIAAATLALQVLASLLPARPSAGGPRVAAAVIVPAHNESATLGATLPLLMREIRAGDRLIVVADNASDDTAAVARALGAEVVERRDAERVGKAYALEAGVRHLAATGAREVVVFVDADCVLAPGALDRLVAAADAEDAPVQGRYAMHVAADADVRQRIGAFAWRVKNEVRPAGFRALGLPCQLMGSGMAFPFDLVQSLDLATGHITEDLVLGLESALLDCPPVYCPEAAITSAFAPSAQGRDAQKARWVHGHLATIREYVPTVLLEGVRRRQPALVAMAADVLVPPLGLLVALLAGLNVAAFLRGAAGGEWLAAGIAALAAGLAGAALLVAWARAGRDLLAPGELGAVASYVGRQLGIGWQFLAGRRVGWVRSERSADSDLGTIPATAPVSAASLPTAES